MDPETMLLKNYFLKQSGQLPGKKCNVIKTAGNFVQIDLFLVSHLHGSHFVWVEAIAHEHDQRVSDSSKDSHGLCVRHPQQAVVVHLQDAHANLQPAVSGCCAARAHLFEYQPKEG